MIGASGGISGIVIYFCLKFSHARIGMMFRLRWIHVPARMALVAWLALQFLGAYEQLSGISNVSSFAHLGGATVGFLFWLVHRSR